MRLWRKHGTQIRLWFSFWEKGKMIPLLHSQVYPPCPPLKDRVKATDVQSEGTRYRCQLQHWWQLGSGLFLSLSESQVPQAENGLRSPTCQGCCVTWDSKRTSNEHNFPCCTSPGWPSHCWLTFLAFLSPSLLAQHPSIAKKGCSVFPAQVPSSAKSATSPNCVLGSSSFSCQSLPLSFFTTAPKFIVTTLWIQYFVIFFLLPLPLETNWASQKIALKISGHKFNSLVDKLFPDNNEWR